MALLASPPWTLADNGAVVLSLGVLCMYRMKG